MNIIAMTLGMITVGNGTIIQNLKAVGTGFPPFIKITNEKTVVINDKMSTFMF